MRRDPAAEPGRFRDPTIDRIPYEEMPYELLLHQEAQGDRKATAEIKRRAAVEVERMVQERINAKREEPGGAPSTA